MQISLVQLTHEWKPFSDIVTPEDDAVYYIQNRGADTLVALESSSEPSETDAGSMVLPYKECKYVKGSQDLYLRAFNEGCEINVTKVG